MDAEVIAHPAPGQQALEALEAPGAGPCSCFCVAGAGAQMSTVDQPSASTSATDVVAGLLAAASVVLSALAMGAGLLLQLDGHPGRTIPVAAVLAIVAGVMSARFQAMALKALGFAAVAWVIGMTIAVLTKAPLL
jgi:hypothetical protein